MILFVCLMQFDVSAVGAIKLASDDNSATELNTEVNEETSSWEGLTKKERKLKKKEFRNEIKELKKAGDLSSETLLLVIIALFIPPLAMLLYDGISIRFWLSLLLTFLFFLPGLIYTLVVILKD